MSSLNDRQFETHRRVAPGRLSVNRNTGNKHPEEFATAVVDAFGAPLLSPLQAYMEELLFEVRRTNRLLEIIADEEVSLDDAAS